MSEDTPVSNVVTLHVVKGKDEEGEVPTYTDQQQANIRMLETVLAAVKRNEVHALVLQVRSAAGAVSILASHSCDEIQAIGMCQVAIHMMVSRMQRVPR